MSREPEQEVAHGSSAAADRTDLQRRTRAPVPGARGQQNLRHGAGYPDHPEHHSGGLARKPAVLQAIAQERVRDPGAASTKQLSRVMSISLTDLSGLQ